MKIRHDYVSNSSSSSFMIVGNSYETDELVDAFKKHDLSINDEYYLSVSIKKLLEKFGLQCDKGIYDYYNRWCIGLHFNEMKDNETKTQFIERIGERLEKLFGTKQEVEEIVDGGMDN